MSRVAIVGPGRLGGLLAAACVRAGHPVVAVAGGSEDARAAFAERVAGCRVVGTPAEAAARAELVLLTVPDDAIEEVADGLARADAVADGHRIVHLAGAHGTAPLRRVALTGARVAACHPAMTVPRGASDPDLLVGAAWAVTCASEDLGWAEELVRDLGGDPQRIAEEDRVLYHAALALGANALGAAVVTARRLLLAARVADPVAFLAPLAHASVDAVLALGVEALTGPVVRADLGTVGAHLDAVERDLPELAAAHVALLRANLEVARPLLDARAEAIDRLLRAAEERRR
jgi:predicted short-subunit dehydrogenase-like oxidoreductase (DUF2520 family)